MPPKQKATGAKGPSKSAKSDKRADSEKQITPDQSDFLDQTFKEDYERRGVFIEKLIERLTQYGEDGTKLHDAYKDETDLPKPKLKTGATTASQRLSVEEGARPTDSIPEIRDLSDPNRPLSLAEKFSELYDNEWTDAMEEIAEKMLEETKAIKLLLDIVFDAYKFCLYRSDKIMDTINSTLDGFLKEFGLSQVKTMEVSKTNKNYLKQLAVHVVKYIEQDFAKEMKIKMKTKVGARTEAYMKRCVSVCWFMTVHDPKVVMTTKQPELFDEDLYRTYAKKGQRIDYLVWPALYLHEGGPLIGKGVAQGK